MTMTKKITCASYTSVYEPQQAAKSRASVEAAAKTPRAMA